MPSQNVAVIGCMVFESNEYRQIHKQTNRQTDNDTFIFLCICLYSLYLIYIYLYNFIYIDVLTKQLKYLNHCQMQISGRPKVCNILYKMNNI